MYLLTAIMILRFDCHDSPVLGCHRSLAVDGCSVDSAGVRYPYIAAACAGNHASDLMSCQNEHNHA